jgi:alpha-ketoglutarate-dependent taurine dioxygenase
LEYGWEQCTEEEKSAYDNVEIVNHNMYVVNHLVETFPFLKTNPKTGKISPRLNSMTNPNRAVKKVGGWVNHIRVDGVALDWEQGRKLSYDLIDILEKKTDTLYEHHWDEGDIIVYDNWFNIHKRSRVDATGVAGGRLLRRLSFNFE